MVFAYNNYITVEKTKAEEKHEEKHYIGAAITAPVTALAYTPTYIAAGHEDGSLTLIDQPKKWRHEFSCCHTAPVTSILYVDSLNICVLAGGNGVTLIKIPSAASYNQGMSSIEVDIESLIYGNDKKGKPILADMVAIAGLFIISKTKDNKSYAQHIYSHNALNAIHYGIFDICEKNFLVRMIEANQNQKNIVLSSDEQKILDNLCPTIRRILSAEFEK
ncbi:MAG TPA: hypothetical protein VGW78_01095 [Candidatus Babeliales bacterium]|jgi:hypothetical protein|nr:hypothetical protein [Candidatus Babeliales bacterium]